MKALILNSGTGTRMGSLTRNIPKCLITLYDNETILSRQLKQLNNSNISEVVITTGPFGNAIQSYVNTLFSDLSVKFIENTLYDSTNYIYSMYLAKDLLKTDLLLMHGDIIVSSDLMKAFISNSPMNSVIVDKNAELPEKDFKASIYQEKIKMISVDIFGDSVYSLMPVYKLNQGFMIQWLSVIESFINQKKDTVYAEDALNTITDNVELNPWFLSEGFCMEIDTVEDLHKAREHFLCL